MKRHEVSEEEWAILDPLLPQSVATTGRPPRDRRQMLNGILWILSTGSQGEPRSALNRMALGEHREIRVKQGDTIIISPPAGSVCILNTVQVISQGAALVISANVIFIISNGVVINNNTTISRL